MSTTVSSCQLTHVRPSTHQFINCNTTGNTSKAPIALTGIFHDKLPYLYVKTNIACDSNDTNLHLVHCNNARLSENPYKHKHEFIITVNLV